jgi:TM2 domain-containing membrane protein YozV
VISGDDGKRYTVARDDLKGGAHALMSAATVDFEVSDNRAVSVYPIVGSLSGDRNKWIAAVLAFFLGYLGVHKFYLGRKKQGIIMLLCFFPGMFLYIPALASVAIAFVEAVIYLVKGEQQFFEEYVVGERAWF